MGESILLSSDLHLGTDFFPKVLSTVSGIERRQGTVSFVGLQAYNARRTIHRGTPSTLRASRRGPRRVCQGFENTRRTVFQEQEGCTNHKQRAKDRRRCTRVACPKTSLTGFTRQPCWHRVSTHRRSSRPRQLQRKPHSGQRNYRVKVECLRSR